MPDLRVATAALAACVLSACGSRFVTVKGDSTACSHVRIVMKTSMQRDAAAIVQHSADPADSRVSGEGESRTIGVLLSVSLSMREKMPIALDALTSFVDAMHPETNVFLLKYGTNVTLVHRTTSNRSELKHAIQETHVTSDPSHGGWRPKAPRLMALALLPFDPVENYQTRDLEVGACLYDAVLAGACLVRRASDDQRALVVITDGGTSKSSASMDDVLRAIGTSRIPIYTIVVGDPDPRWWQRPWGAMHATVPQLLSEKTRGTSFFVHYRGGAESQIAIEKALQQITTELDSGTPSRGFTYVYNEDLDVFERVSSGTPAPR